MRRRLRKEKLLPEGNPAMEKATEAVRAVLVKWPDVWRQKTRRGTYRKRGPQAPDGAIWTVFCEQMAYTAIRAAINEILK